MTFAFKHRFWQRRQSTIVAACLLVGMAIAVPIVPQLMASRSPYRYRFTRPMDLDTMGQLQRELAFYQARIRQNPEDGLDRASLATVYLKLARATGYDNWYLLAEQSAEQSLEHLPFNNSGAILVQANIAAAKHDFDRSISLANQVLATSPQNEDALSLVASSYLGKGQIDRAEAAARQLLDRIPTLGAYTLMALVDVARGKDEAALQNFQNALAAEEPGEAVSSARTRTLLARFYASRGQLHEAEQLYRAALRILPRSPLVLTQLAQLETRLGDYRAAERRYAEVVISGDYPNAWDHVARQGMAQIAVLQGDRDRAQQLWQQAEAVFRQHQDLSTFGHRRELARLLLLRDREEDLPEALALMEADLKVRRDWETLDTYAWALMRLNRWQEARSTLQEAISTGNRHAVMFYRAARVEQHLDNAKAAAAYVQQAQETDPTFGTRDRLLWGLEP